MENKELASRLAGIEQRLDAQLVWQAAVTPVLLAMLETLDDKALQLRIVTLIEQADALALWSALPAADRERAREYAELLRHWPQQRMARAMTGNHLPDSPR